MQFPLPTIAAQFDYLGGALGVAVAVAVSFLAITLVSSYYRFQNIVRMAEETQPEEMGTAPEEILRVQMARYLAGCARRGTSFSISLIRLVDSSIQVRMGTPFTEAVKLAARHGDVTCIFDDRTAVLLTEAESGDSPTILARIADRIPQLCAEVLPGQLRIGIASYPGHGLRGKDLVRTALSGLEQADAAHPIAMPEIVDPDAEEEAGPQPGEAPETAAAKGWRERRRSAMLDELTGVLKPSAVSAYMQRMMSDLRHKKKRAALFCLGVNNMEHIARFHGQEAANDVLVGVSRILQENLRADDLIGRHEKYAFLVLAEATLAEAETIGKRISTLVQQAEITTGNKRLKTTITLGVATYPEHGRNLHHLYTSGQKVLDHSRANDIRAYAVYDPQIHDKVPPKPMRNIKSVQA